SKGRPRQGPVRNNDGVTDQATSVNPAIRVESFTCMQSAPGLLLRGPMTARREEWEYLAKSSASGRPRDVLGSSTVARESRTDDAPLLEFPLHEVPKPRGRASDRFTALLDRFLITATASSSARAGAHRPARRRERA